MDFTSLQTGMGLWGLALSSFVISLSGAVMPGPVLAVTITHTVRRGFWAGPLIVTGHGLIELALLAGLVLGLGPIITKPLIAGGIGAVGGAVLLWMGLGMLRSLPGMSLQEIMSGEGPQGRHPVWDGLVLSAANPYFVIWWATVGLGLLVAASNSTWGWLGLAAFYIGHIGADLAWYGLVSATVSKGRSWLSDNIYKWVVGVCAAVLLVFSVYFGVFAWHKLGSVWA